MYSLLWIIEHLKVGQVAKAEFAIDSYWYITKGSDGAFRYCDRDGRSDQGLVDLSFSNMRAFYTIIKE